MRVTNGIPLGCPLPYLLHCKFRQNTEGPVNTVRSNPDGCIRKGVSMILINGFSLPSTCFFQRFYRYLLRIMVEPAENIGHPFKYHNTE
jgi:hypothetical protein